MAHSVIGWWWHCLEDVLPDVGGEGDTQTQHGRKEGGRGGGGTYLRGYCTVQYLRVRDSDGMLNFSPDFDLSSVCVHPLIIALSAFILRGLLRLDCM